MKRVLMLVFVSFFVGLSAFAGPFGLSNGMTLEQVTEACGGVKPKKIENDDRYLIQPVKRHSMFKTYIACISKDFGLYSLRVISSEIKTNNSGEEIKNEFYAFKERLEKIYGKSKLNDEITDSKNSLTENASDWLLTLYQGARTLSAEWENLSSSELKQIKLDAECFSLPKTCLVLDYIFANQEKKVENLENVYFGDEVL